MDGELSVSFATALSVLSAVASGAAMLSATLRRTAAHAVTLELVEKRLARLEHWRTAELALERGKAADDASQS
jgi:hypothetical protein